MSANAGPDIIEDGIVFYYDTGNTIKSYIGEPTTNLVGTIATHYGGNVSTSYANGQYQTNAIVINGTDSSVPSGNYSRFNGTTADTNSQTYWTIQGNAVVNEANQTVSFSVYLKGNGTCHLATYNDHSGYQVGPDITLTDTWTKYSITKTIGTFTDYHWVAVRGIITSTDVFISSAQWERKSHATQYTPSSRSATQGLLDMTRTSTINITNASFDNNAQIEFDGTNDYTDSGYDLSWNNTNSVSVEFMVKPYTVSGGNYGIIGKEYPNWEWAFYQSSTTLNLVYWDYGGGHSNGMDFSVNIFPTANTWYHVIYTWDTTTSIFYVNGTAAGSRVAVDPSINQNRSNNVMIGGHTYVWSDSYFNGKLDLVKFYNKALTASEVRTNFNALRTRFGI